MTGLVVDTSNNPIPGVVVFRNGMPAATTDGNGAFEFFPVAGDLLEFKMIGYSDESYEVVDGVTAISITMEETSYVLSTVQIVADKVRKNSNFLWIGLLLLVAYYAYRKGWI